MKWQKLLSSVECYLAGTGLDSSPASGLRVSLAIAQHHSVVMSPSHLNIYSYIALPMTESDPQL